MQIVNIPVSTVVKFYTIYLFFPFAYDTEASVLLIAQIDQMYYPSHAVVASCYFNVT